MWHTANALVRHGFQQSDVVMINEAHDGWKRCRRTRELGERLLETAYSEGVRHLAMEALTEEAAEQANRSGAVPDTDHGYLRQPDMRSFITRALQLGFTLIAYEADPSLIADGLPFWERARLRDLLQARNLAASLATRAPEKLLVWVGNGHLVKTPVRTPDGDYPQMACHLRELTSIEPFCIDQTLTVDWEHCAGEGPRRAEPFRADLEKLGGTAGFLKEEAPPPFDQFAGVDAFVLSLFNVME